jgi:pimeloyl-ACP methyl ester carboxylesterase
MMTDPVLLVPGTQATTLRDSRQTRVYNAVSAGLPLFGKSLGGRPRSQWVELMSMSHVPGHLEPERTSLEPGEQILPFSVVQTPYQLFPKYYEEWPYDWRADLRWNADRLLSELRSRVGDDGTRMTLVGHSQGGLLIVLASKRAEEGEFARLVSRVILVGVPFAGTMRAVEALVFGSPSFGKKHRDLALRMARSWPAIYQMLPAWDAVTDARGNPLPPEEQLLSPGGWPAGQSEGISEDMLERARSVQEDLVDPFEKFGPGVAVTTVLSNNQTTGVRLVRSGNRLDRIESEKRSGDDLVPYEQTIRWGGNSFAFTVTPFAGQTRSHAELCADPTVAAFVINSVNAPAREPVEV